MRGPQCAGLLIGRKDLVTYALLNTKVPGVSTSFFVPDIANHVPHMQITRDSRVSLEPQQVSQLLWNPKPAIVIGGGRPGLTMCSFMLQPGEDTIVAEQLSRIPAPALSIMCWR